MDQFLGLQGCQGLKGQILDLNIFIHGDDFNYLCSIWPPPASWIFLNLLGQDLRALSIMFWGVFLMHNRIAFLSLRSFVTFICWTLFLIYPQRKKSHGAASGEFGSHSSGVMKVIFAPGSTKKTLDGQRDEIPTKAMTLSGKFFRSNGGSSERSGEGITQICPLSHFFWIFFQMR